MIALTAKAQKGKSLAPHFHSPENTLTEAQLQKIDHTLKKLQLKPEQYQKTKIRISELGLEQLVSVELMDYRDLAASGRTFDKIASVGMLEHVGKTNLNQFMAAVQKILNPGGLALIHSITHITEGEPNSWIKKHIFPGGYVPSLREITSPVGSCPGVLPASMQALTLPFSG